VNSHSMGLTSVLVLLLLIMIVVFFFFKPCPELVD
jgi:hypothetical protein